MSSSKKLTCKGTLRQVFITVSHVGISTKRCELLPVLPSLWFKSPFPLSSLFCEYWISILYTRIQCVGGGGGIAVLCLRQINACRKVPLQDICLNDDILHCLLWVLCFNEQTPLASLILRAAMQTMKIQISSWILCPWLCEIFLILWRIFLLYIVNKNSYRNCKGVRYLSQQTG